MHGSELVLCCSKVDPAQHLICLLQAAGVHAKSVSGVRLISLLLPLGRTQVWIHHYISQLSFDVVSTAHQVGNICE